MIIDAYSHGVHGGVLEDIAGAGGEWAKKAIARLHSMTDEARPHATNIARRLEMLDRTGIDLQVVAPFSWMDCTRLPGNPAAKLAYAQVINNSMAKMMEDSKGRLISVGTTVMEAFEPLGRQEMERAVKTLGLKAVIVLSNIKGKPLDLPEFEPFWALAAELDIAVYIHPSDVADTSGRPYEADFDLMHNFGWPFETELTLSRLVFSGIMERYPGLKVVSHHLGGGLPFFWGRTMETYDPVGVRIQPFAVDLPKPLFDYYSRFYYDTAVGGSAAAIRCAYEVFGADHIILATDAPWGPGTGEIRLQTYPQAIKSLGLSEAENRKILGDNIRGVLKLG